MKLNLFFKKMNLKTVKRCFHTSVVMINICSFIHAAILIAFAEKRFHDYQFMIHGWQCKEIFLSVWVSVVQFIYFGIHSAIDIIDLYSQKNKLLLKLQDHLNIIASYLLFSIVFPFSLMVFVLFWFIYHWNREIIYPTFMDDLFPVWLNHVMHSLPVPLSIMYMLISNKREPSKTSTLFGLVLFTAVYSCVFFNFYLKEGKFIYMALEFMTPIQVKWALSFAAFAPICFLFLGYKINRCMEYIKKQSALVMIS